MRTLRCRGALRGFREDRRGGVALLFALFLSTIMLVIGCAVDYSRASGTRTRLQNALDAAVLATAAQSAGKSNTQLETDAKAQLANLFKASGSSLTSSTATATSSSLTMNATASVTTSFLRLFGLPNMTVGGKSATQWGASRLRVAMVLDNTGSMQDAGKMDALKVASKKFIDQMKATSKSAGDVYISVIPFNKFVNVGTSNVNASWLDRTDITNCWLWYCSVGAWDGSVADRDESYDTLNTAPSSSLTRFPAVNAPGNDPTPLKLTPLSYDWTNLTAQIDLMVPAGGTNQLIGLAWGWQSLTQGAPLNAPAEPSGYTYYKALIIMSDGLNTESRRYGNGRDPSPETDARQAILCQNIKNAGIIVYAIQVNTDGAATSNVLKNCASTADKFILMTDPTKLTETFAAIGQQLAGLRLSK